MTSFQPKFETAFRGRQSNILTATASCVTAATSVTSTLIIGTQIYFATISNTQAQRRYEYIIRIIIHSSALYSISLLAQATIGFLNNGNLQLVGSGMIIAEDYITVALTIMTVCHLKPAISEIF